MVETAPAVRTAETHEDKVRKFYEEGPDGEYAGAIYSELMNDIWFHGDPALEQAGATPREAAVGTLRRLASELNIQPGQRVLDFGSGPGGGLIELAAMTDAVCVGLSSTETLNIRARQRAADKGMAGRISFLTVGPQDYRSLLAWPDAAFTHAFAMESVCHVTDPTALFTALYRVIAPGGYLIVRDWGSRAWGQHQTPEQISQLLEPVCESIRLAGLHTADQYAAMLVSVGFEVERAVDAFADQLCWGATPPEDRDKWLHYRGPAEDLFRRAKRNLDAARGAGVFTVVELKARKPGSSV